MTTAFEARPLAKKGVLLKKDTLLRNNTNSPVHGKYPKAQRRVAVIDQESGSRTPDQLNAQPVPAWKRGLDIVCVLISLPITLPLIAAVALWIKFASRGPTLFRQERIGRNGKRFIIYKFRSMKVNAPTRRHVSHFGNLVRSNCPMVKLDLLCDSRLITGGCLLRAAGLDELPQLLNVLRGEMSLVGPRPCLPEEYRFFTARQRERFEALPGLTGIWQVNGKNSMTFSEMNAMDALYVRRSSVLLDLSIMLRTPVALFRQMAQAFDQDFGSDKPNRSHVENGAVSNFSGRSLG